MWIFSPAPLSPASTCLDAAVDGMPSAMEEASKKVYSMHIRRDVYCIVDEGRPRSMAELVNCHRFTEDGSVGIKV